MYWFSLYLRSGICYKVCDTYFPSDWFTRRLLWTVANESPVWSLVDHIETEGQFDFGFSCHGLRGDSHGHADLTQIRSLTFKKATIKIYERECILGT